MNANRFFRLITSDGLYVGSYGFSGVSCLPTPEGASVWTTEAAALEHAQWLLVMHSISATVARP